MKAGKNTLRGKFIGTGGLTDIAADGALPTRLRSQAVEATDTAIAATVEPSTGDSPTSANKSGHLALILQP